MGGVDGVGGDGGFGGDGGVASGVLAVVLVVVEVVLVLGLVVLVLGLGFLLGIVALLLSLAVLVLVLMLCCCGYCVASVVPGRLPCVCSPPCTPVDVVEDHYFMSTQTKHATVATRQLKNTRPWQAY